MWLILVQKLCNYHSLCKILSEFWKKNSFFIKFKEFVEFEEFKGAIETAILT